MLPPFLALRLGGRRRSSQAALCIAALWLSLGRSTPADESSPEETLRRFLSAMQNQQFQTAYDLASRGMKRERAKEEWAERMRNLLQPSQAKIVEFEVFPGRIEGERAFVPSIMRSQDKFLHQFGVEERELYRLVKEDGAWKVDGQEGIVSNGEVTKWFPKRASSGCNRVQ